MVARLLPIPVHLVPGAGGSMEQRSRWRRISVSCASVYRVEIRRYVEVLSAREAQLRDNAAQCEVSAGMLAHDPEPQVQTEDNKKTWARFKAAVWEPYGQFAGGGDLVGEKLCEFRTTVAAACPGSP